jgi:D-threo-aldose 1-dehydrogenase
MTHTDPSSDVAHPPLAGRLGTIRTRFAPDGTSEIGFGCALLMGSVPRDQSLRLLATAHDHGVRHFDTARLYGHGWSEGVLGAFLQGRRDRVTIATKFGLEPPTLPAPIARLRAMARAALDTFSPGLRTAVGRGAQRLVRRGAFGVADARRALERSLRLLRTDRVDLWLLHDCTLEDVVDGELEAFLDAERARGTILAHGIATSGEETRRIAGARPSYASVVQIADDPVAPISTILRPVLRNRADIVQHSVPRSVLDKLPDMAADPLARSILKGAGVDPGDAGRMAALALAAARRTNPRGVTLVSSSRPDHLSRLLASFTDPSTPGAIDALHSALATVGGGTAGTSS